MANVLVVEDREDTAQLLNEILSRDGHKVSIAEDGKTALKMAQDKPDLIILDLMLPEMSGEQVLQKLKDDSETSKIKVIILSAAAIGKAEKDMLLAQGADEVLLKPIKNERLLQFVNDTISGV